jgi:anti-anti-sigma factor
MPAGERPLYDTLIEIATHDAACVVTVKSDIDVANAETLGRYVEEAASGASALVVSLEACRYIDSTGIRPLLRFAAARGETFCVVAPRGSRVRRVFDLLHLHERIRVCESLAEALVAVQPKPVRA